MDPNPILRKLGLADHDRAVILHADDVGMCRASLAAYAELHDFGLVSAASTMVPCPWFPATAAFCHSRPADQVDMGVHLTLTSEWEGYRWGPISSRDPISGLMDEAGYFPDTSQALQEQVDPEAARCEIEAQIERALAAGIDVTHLDTHMGSILHPKIVGAYLEAALAHRIPPLLLRLDEAGFRAMDMDRKSAAMFAQMMHMLEAQGLPLMDHLHLMALDQPADRIEQVKEVLQSLPPGLTYLIFHPAQDSAELRAIAPDWRCRVADYRALTSEALRAFIRQSGIEVIGWRPLRALI